MNLPAVVEPKGPGGQITTWCQSVGLLLKSGVAVDAAIELSWQQTGNGPFKRDLDLLLSELMCGRRLSSAMSKYRIWFPPSLIEAVHAGEESGQLAEVLLRWSKSEENRVRIKDKVLGSLVYPLCVFLTTAAIFGFLLTCIVPKLVTIFAAHGGKLPALTAALLKASAYLFSPFSLLVGSLVLAAIITFLKSQRGYETALRLALRFPIIGTVWRSYLISNFCQYLSLFLSGGIALPKAISLCGKVSGNPIMRSCAEAAHQDVNVGVNLVQALEKTSFFPEDVLSLINTGAETDNLERVLDQAAQSHNNLVEMGTSTAISLIEPSVIALMGFVVATLVIAIYLPILRLTAIVVQ